MLFVAAAAANRLKILSNVVWSLLVVVHICRCYEINGFENRPGSEQRLIERLFKSYNRKLRPPGSVQVKFALNLNQIVNLNQKDQIMVLNAFIDHEWIDPRLSWDPLKYDNISIIRVSGDQLWTPDTFIYTTADHTGFLLPQSGAQFVIRHEGVIFWPNPLTQMQVRCRMGIVWFPFDDQLCVIVFGSWSFTCGYLNYTLMNEDPSLDNYTENNEWTLIAFRPYRHEIKYTNWIENDSFSEIHYKILIRRKPLFVIQNCVVPAIMLCILTLVSFFIPFAQSMQIGISIMLAFSVFKLRLSDDVPVQADTVPLVNIYFTLCMSFSLNAMIWFSFINLMRGRKRVPNLIRVVVVKYICFVLRFKLRRPSHANCGTSSSPRSSSITDSTANKIATNHNQLMLISNKDGTMTTTTAVKPQIVVDDTSVVAPEDTKARISAYYKSINDASFRSQFAARNSNTNSRRSDKVDVRRKKKVSTATASKQNPKTQSDSEFEKELERLKQKKRALSRVDDEFMCAYEVSDTCEEDSRIVWVPQPRSIKQEKKLSHLKYLEKKSQGGDGGESVEFYPIRIDYDSSQIGDFDDEADDETRLRKRPHHHHHHHHHQRHHRHANPHRHYSRTGSIHSMLVNQGDGGGVGAADTPMRKALSVSSRSVATVTSSRQGSTIEINRTALNNNNTSQQGQEPGQGEQHNNESDKNQELSDAKVIKILNEFVFYLFLIFCILLNVLGLWVFPYFIKLPLSVDNS